VLNIKISARYTRKMKDICRMLEFPSKELEKALVYLVAD
jgi:hypothetical protein